MHNQLIPLLVLLILPALYLGQRLGIFGRRSARWAAGVLLGLAIVLSLPFEGLDFVHLKRIKLLLAAATALLLLLPLRDKLSREEQVGVRETVEIGLADKIRMSYSPTV